jgi:hypothetical protein
MKSIPVVSRAIVRVSRPSERQLDIYVGIVWMAVFVGFILMVMLLSAGRPDLGL